LDIQRRKFFYKAAVVGIAGIASASTLRAANYSAVVPCSYCGTGFRVTWNGTDSGYGVYQCPKCNKGSRVHWNPNGVEKVEKA
jgi:transcription elongation factor Elf1